MELRTELVNFVPLVVMISRINPKLNPCKQNMTTVLLRAINI